MPSLRRTIIVPSNEIMFLRRLRADLDKHSYIHFSRKVVIAYGKFKLFSEEFDWFDDKTRQFCLVTVIVDDRDTNNLCGLIEKFRKAGFENFRVSDRSWQSIVATGYFETYLAAPSEDAVPKDVDKSIPPEVKTAGSDASNHGSLTPDSWWSLGSWSSL